MHALAERLAIAWQQRPVQIPDTILVPEKIEVDSIRSISSYPEKWPDNYNSVKGIEIEGESKGEYAIVRDEVEKMQGELFLIKAKHSYYKSMHKQLKELLARQIEDSLLTPDIAKDLDGINTKICRITDALEKGTIHGP
ncbi:hypothetical protein BDF19DRAFT_439552 [Syncephalis fuscata]|nr:hypothetical protein BDF19DRAFT_439552 [Syncephalis fuscata]